MRSSFRASVRSNSQTSVDDSSSRSRASINSQIVGKPPGWAYVDGIDEVYEMKKRLSRSLTSAGRGIRRVVMSEQRKEEQELERQRKRFSASMFEVLEDPWHKRDEALLERLARPSSRRLGSLARRPESVARQPHRVESTNKSPNQQQELPQQHEPEPSSSQPQQPVHQQPQQQQHTEQQQQHERQKVQTSSVARGITELPATTRESTTPTMRAPRSQAHGQL
jgi:hypothetical protein